MSTPSIVFPTRGLADKSFRYRSAGETDIRKTFARFKRDQAEARADDITGQQRLELVPSLPLRGAK